MHLTLIVLETLTLELKFMRRWNWSETWRSCTSAARSCSHTLQTSAFGCQYHEGFVQSGDIQVCFDGDRT